MKRLLAVAVCLLVLGTARPLHSQDYGLDLTLGPSLKSLVLFEINVSDLNESSHWEYALVVKRNGNTTLSVPYSAPSFEESLRAWCATPPPPHVWCYELGQSVFKLGTSCLDNP